MRGLTIIVAGADRQRFRAALEIAAAQAALGRPARLFLQTEAVPLLRSEAPAPVASAEELEDLPTSSELLVEALALGVRLICCQSGLAAAGFRADHLPDAIESGGLVALLADAEEDQLLMA